MVSVEWIDPLKMPRQRNFPPAPCTTESFINSVDYFDRNVPIADTGAAKRGLGISENTDQLSGLRDRQKVDTNRPFMHVESLLGDCRALWP